MNRLFNLATLLAASAFADHLREIMPFMPYLGPLEMRSNGEVYSNEDPSGSTIGKYNFSDRNFYYNTGTVLNVTNGEIKDSKNNYIGKIKEKNYAVIEDGTREIGWIDEKGNIIFYEQ